VKLCGDKNQGNCSSKKGIGPQGFFISPLSFGEGKTELMQLNAKMGLGPLTPIRSDSIS